MKEEERRFLRALIPGILFIVELCIVLLLILDKSQIKGIFDLLISTNNRYCQVFCVNSFEAKRWGRNIAVSTFPIGAFLQCNSIFTQINARRL